MPDEIEQGQLRVAAFPPRSQETVRVDSVSEEYAYIQAYPAPGGSWSVVSQTLRQVDAEMVDTVIVHDPMGQERSIQFDVTRFQGSPGIVRLEGLTTEHLDRLMQRAGEFARRNPPHHPGSLPRFPVPSGRYARRIDVPLAVLAVESGQRGLYAPPRVATLDYPTGEFYGVGEFPDFDPNAWPPPRLGDWPPPTIVKIDRLCLRGLVSRFSACSTRLMDVWFGEPPYPQLADEAAEWSSLLSRLDLPAMQPIYTRLSPMFMGWIRDHAEVVGTARNS